MKRKMAPVARKNYTLMTEPIILVSKHQKVNRQGYCSGHGRFENKPFEHGRPIFAPVAVQRYRRGRPDEAVRVDCGDRWMRRYGLSLGVSACAFRNRYVADSRPRLR